MKQSTTTSEEIHTGPGVAAGLLGKPFSVFGTDKDRAAQGRSSALSMRDLLALQHSLDLLSSPVAMLDARCRLVFANAGAEALFGDGDAIFVDNADTVRCRNRSAQVKLQTLVAAVIADGEGGRIAVRRAFAIPKEEGWSLSALITGQPAATGQDGKIQRVVLHLRDPGVGLHVGSEFLSLMFGLSQAEAAVVALLVAGRGLDEIADERGVSLVTVRNQMKSALAKFGVNRQVELVSVVLRAAHF